MGFFDQVAGQVQQPQSDTSNPSPTDTSTPASTDNTAPPDLTNIVGSSSSKGKTATTDITQILGVDPNTAIPDDPKPQDVPSPFGGTISLPESNGEVTLAQFLQDRLLKMNDKDVTALQDQLEGAGLITKGTYRRGMIGGGADGNILNDPTVKAIVYIWQTAKAHNTTFADALDMITKHPDPLSGTTIKTDTPQDAAVRGKNEQQTRFVTMYQNEWGVPPSAQTIAWATGSGMNLWELQAHERAKPAWKTSPSYQYMRIKLEDQLSKEWGFQG